MEIVKEEKEKIQQILTAHIIPLKFFGKDAIEVPMIASQSVTPGTLNNPGYSTLTIGDKLGSLLIHSFQLQYYIAFGTENWLTIESLKDYGIDLNDPITF